MRPKLDARTSALTPAADSVIAQGAFVSQLLLDQLDSVLPAVAARGARSMTQTRI
jgi:hypothetical protein